MIYKKLIIIIYKMTDGWLISPDGWKDIDDNNVLEKSLIKNNLKNDNDIDLKLYDQEHVFILAGGLDEKGGNQSWVKDRLDIFIKLYNIKKRYVYILGGGTYHKPPHLNNLGYVMHECTIGAKYLIDNNVDENHIKREWSSYDTIANAYFSLTNFVITLGLNNILIITSDFHIERTKVIFNWLYGLFYGNNIKLSYLKTISSNMDKNVFEKRCIKETTSIINFNKVIEKIKTIKDFTTWFYNEHNAYNCDFITNIHKLIDIKNDEIKNDDVKNSY